MSIMLKKSVIEPSDLREGDFYLMPDMSNSNPITWILKYYHYEPETDTYIFECIQIIDTEQDFSSYLSGCMKLPLYEIKTLCHCGKSTLLWAFLDE